MKTHDREFWIKRVSRRRDWKGFDQLPAATRAAAAERFATLLIQTVPPDVLAVLEARALARSSSAD